MPEYYKYKNYEEYIKLQRRRSRRTRGETQKRERQREWIYNKMIEVGVEGKTMLCLGARDDSEIEFFEKKGYKVDGIDLYETNKIIECDMSKIYEHKYFKNKKYDIVFASDSIEHCLDFDGFIKGLNFVCDKYFVCRSPTYSNRVSEWDCAVHLFMENCDDPDMYYKNLKESFSQFNIVINELDNRRNKRRLFFILRKK